MDTKTVYVPVPIAERLPELNNNNGESSDYVTVVINKESYKPPAKCWGDPAGLFYQEVPMSAYLTKDGWYHESGEFFNLSNGEKMLYWLEKQKMVVITKDEFETLQNEHDRQLSMTFEEGASFGRNFK